MDEETLRFLRRFAPYTMTDMNRLGFLYEELKRVIEDKVPGDFVECGVWRGGNCLMAATMFRDAGIHKEVWLFDTFSGMPPPSPEDGTKATKKYEKTKGTGWCKASLESVEKTFDDFGFFDLSEWHCIKGRVEDTLKYFGPKEICILREDTDFYTSTKASLEYLGPKVSKGGVVILDDYGKWEGQKKATDEYIELNGHLELQCIPGDEGLRYIRIP